MSFRKSILTGVLLIALTWNPIPGFACDQCGCAFNAKRSHGEVATGATVLTPTASTLGKGHGFAGVLFEYVGEDAIPAQKAHLFHDQGRDVHDKTHEQFYTLAGGYGVLPDLDLYLSLPVVARSSLQIEDHDRIGKGERSFGVGDARLVGKYRFWGKGISAAFLAGVKAPTGETSDQDKSGAEFEPELQPGSGSWDFTGGLTVSRSFLDHWTLASAVQYTYRGEGAADEKLGDIFRHDMGLSYALKPLGTHPNVSFVLEVQTQRLDKDRNRGHKKVLDSGGLTVFWSPGLSFDVTDSVAAFVAVPIPVYQDLGGDHQKISYEVVAGASWHF